MPRTTTRLLKKLRELEAPRMHERSPSRGPLSKFTRGLTEFLREFSRLFVFHLIAGPFSIVAHLALAIYVGVIAALLFRWPAIYPVASACLITIMLRYWVRSAEKKRKSHYRP